MASGAGAAAGVGSDDADPPVATVALADAAAYTWRAGGKACGLASLLGAGLRVPPGFVVLGSKTNHAPVPNGVLQAAFAAAFDAGDAGPPLEKVRVAVRSSSGGEDGADASWAGVNESVLGVRRPDLAAAVARVRGREGVEDRAAAYAAKEAQKSGKSDSVADLPAAIGVVVQQMVAPAVSGVAFSRHPVTGENVVVVEAVHGLGTTAVGGRVIPEQIILSKPPRMPSSGSAHGTTADADADAPTLPCVVLSVRETEQHVMAVAAPEADVEADDERLRLGVVGSGGDRGVDGEVEVELPPGLAGARKLSDTQAIDLAKQIAALEELRGHPIDVEWAVSADDGLMYLLQCRPISVHPAGSAGGEGAAGLGLAVRAGAAAVTPGANLKGRKTYEFWFGSRKRVWRAESTALAQADCAPPTGGIDFLRLRDSFCYMETDDVVTFYVNSAVEGERIAAVSARTMDLEWCREYEAAVAKCEVELRALLSATLDTDLATLDTEALAALWERTMAHHDVAQTLYPVGGPLLTGGYQLALADLGLSMEAAADLMTPLVDDVFQREHRAFGALVAAHIARDPGGVAQGVAAQAADAADPALPGERATSEASAGSGTPATSTAPPARTRGGADGPSAGAGAGAGAGSHARPASPTGTGHGGYGGTLQALTPAEAIAHVRRFPHLAANHTSMESLVGALRARYEAALERTVESHAESVAEAAGAGAASTISDHSNVPTAKVIAAAGARASRDVHAARKERCEAIFAEHNEDAPELRALAECARIVCNSRLRVKTCYVGVDLGMIALTNEVQRRCGVDASVIAWQYRRQETLDLIRHGKAVSPETLAKRARGYVIRIHEGGIGMLEGDDAAAFRKSVRISGDDDETEGAHLLTGMVASPGSARGTARVVLSGDSQALAAALWRVRPGDILVSQMTQPDLVEVMEKCAGIITDEGGILSHAAIISREFRIPCCVGTGRATREIVDGDDVEIVGDGDVIIHSWARERVAVPGGHIDAADVADLLDLVLPPPPVPDAPDPSSRVAAECRTGPQQAAAGEAVTLRVIQVTDVYMLDNLPSLRTLIDTYRAGNKAGPTISCLTGDFLAPYLLSSFDKGKGMVETLNALPLDIVTWGNKETDVGHEAACQRTREFKGVWINTNMQGHETFAETQVDEHVVEVARPGGATDDATRHVRRVGFIGILSDAPGLYKGSAFGGAAIADCYETMRVYKERLEADGCDLVVPLCHLYVPQDIVTCERFDFPVVLSGHDHHVVDEVHHGTRLLKAGSDANNAIVLDITWASKDASCKPTITAEVVKVSSFEPNREVQAIVDDKLRVLSHLEGTTLTRVPSEYRPLTSRDSRATMNTMSSFLLSECRDALDADERYGLPDEHDVDLVLVGGGNIRGGMDYEDDEHMTMAALQSEVKATMELRIAHVPGSVLATAVAITHEAPNPGYLHYDDGVTLGADGEIDTIRGEPLDVDRQYLVAVSPTSPGYQPDGQRPPLVRYLLAHPEVVMDEDASFNVHQLLISFWAHNVVADIMEHLDVDGDGVLSREELRALDTNEDGKVDVSDVQNLIRDATGLDVDANETSFAKVVLGLAGDTSGDGQLSPAEIDAMVGRATSDYAPSVGSGAGSSKGGRAKPRPPVVRDSWRK